MSRQELEYQTTIRQARGENAHLQFKRRFGLGERLLSAALPVLWALVAIVVTVVTGWALTK